MRLTDFDFELPEELIAQEPLPERDASRMLVLDRVAGGLSDTSFPAIAEHLEPPDILVINNTKVFPARLYGDTETGARVEVFLVAELERDLWSVLGRPGKRLKVGKAVRFGEGLLARVLEKSDDGRVSLKFEHDGDLETLVDRFGKTPLPPYIKREPGRIDSDRERYQTTYARSRGAIAAPTAGLHFTEEVLETIRAKGVEIIEITLHVGYGTFEPVRVENLSEHRVSAEKFEISSEASKELEAAKRAGRRIVAVGTTTTRALESAANADGSFTAGPQTADLTILPGYEFKAVDALLTNFHLPRSSLLILVSAFAGRESVLNAYRHAVRERYRFYSYGDCMFIR
ncbi:MAG: tRNA preQ1(34) S-adenosylmethionine ribosyltransferase-isomerase QueA [Acidobacteriota bacterium]|nr:tRNA preQ1(34) S-adenosylmethionine ribosyltransferase-isomerase QueA [Acidobacteriota bacterium]